MTPTIIADRGQDARAIHLIDRSGFDTWFAGQPSRVRAAATAQRLVAKPGRVAILPGEQPDDWSVATIVADGTALSPWCLAHLPALLPAGHYRLAGGNPGAAKLGWATAQYRFTRYRKAEDDAPRILLSSEPAHIDEALRQARATALVRDLVNTAAADLGPAELAAHARQFADRHGATLTVTQGHELETGYPMIHAVGKAAAKGREPRLIELTWGNPAHPRVAIVGKGVCFDSGGLDIKPSAGMRLMKKDMGGAAHALALASLVMETRLPVRLHLLVPAVENSVSADSFRPGDVLNSRQGLTVENTNTDAEGRLILGDTLTKACEAAPDLLIDFATLTGAARVALGPDLPATFVNDDSLAADLLAAGTAEHDPLWRMPLWDGYDDMLKSDIADMVNAPEGGMAGAVTAALFLRRFVDPGVAWAHLDTFAWRAAAKPGRAKGGEACGLRAAWRLLKDRYART
ncbi:aminopeptidase [Sphingomonas sp. Leaf407]|uniref:leucyl aminopeptidase family protein n=1 Tax=unclassified Sphingomonas TaxID=196159 RepID=UPI0006F8C5E0|nr:MULTISPECIES: leucyl aminopeptidase family protein [unclassified Sphingomonas]KQN36967.1 aminopeptidase [Sphingomonas sp. Leaf42]KQT30394.1 aminopeptidase [Sphingomonas sp. Leaf407]